MHIHNISVLFLVYMDPLDFFSFQLFHLNYVFFKHQFSIFIFGTIAFLWVICCNLTLSCFVLDFFNLLFISPCDVVRFNMLFEIHIVKEAKFNLSDSHNSCSFVFCLSSVLVVVPYFAFTVS